MKRVSMGATGRLKGVSVVETASSWKVVASVEATGKLRVVV